MDLGHASGRITSTRASLFGLVLGVGVGGLLHRVTSESVDALAQIVEAAGALWMGALQMVVIPLVVCTLFVSIAGGKRTAGVGRMVGWAFLVFIGLLVLGAIFTLVSMPALLAPIDVDPGVMSALDVDVPDDVAAGDAAETPSSILGWLAAVAAWIASLVPTNVIAAVANGNILQIVVFTLLLAFAATRIEEQKRARLVGLFEAMAATIFTLVRWILRFTPIGVFALTMQIARKTGFGIGGVLLQYIAIVCVLLFAFTLVLYPIAVFLGGVRLKAFIRSLLRGQTVGVSTRSSLAALPALMEGAEEELDMRPEVAAFALPLAASTFKMNRTISSTCNLLFLAHVYGIALGPAQVLTFVLTVIILSFSSLGIPSGGMTFKNLPAYVAVGIPIEGYFLIRAIDVIPDIFKTLINVTGYMTSAVLVGKRTRAPDAEPDTEVAAAPPPG